MGIGLAKCLTQCEISGWFQRTTYRKPYTASPTVTWPLTSRDPKTSRSWPKNLGGSVSRYLKKYRKQNWKWNRLARGTESVKSDRLLVINGLWRKGFVGLVRSVWSACLSWFFVVKLSTCVVAVLSTIVLRPVIIIIVVVVVCRKLINTNWSSKRAHTL